MYSFLNVFIQNYVAHFRPIQSFHWPDFLLVTDISAMGISWLLMASRSPPTSHFSSLPLLPAQCHLSIPAMYRLCSDDWGKEITLGVTEVHKEHCMLSSKWWNWCMTQLVLMSREIHHHRRAGHHNPSLSMMWFLYGIKHFPFFFYFE